MFSLFSARKGMNKKAARAFWRWFEDREEWIISHLGSGSHIIVWVIDEHLKPIFPYFKGELEFQLGFNEGKGEFFFYHFGDEHLKKDADVLGQMMPASMSKRWTFSTDE